MSDRVMHSAARAAGDLGMSTDLNTVGHAFMQSAVTNVAQMWIRLRLVSIRKIASDANRHECCKGDEGFFDFHCSGSVCRCQVLTP